MALSKPSYDIDQPESQDDDETDELDITEVYQGLFILNGNDISSRPHIEDCENIMKFLQSVKSNTGDCEHVKAYNKAALHLFHKLFRNIKHQFGNGNHYINHNRLELNGMSISEFIEDLDSCCNLGRNVKNSGIGTSIHAMIELAFEMRNMFPNSITAKKNYVH